MLRGLMSMPYLDVLDLDDIIAVIGFDDQMNSKKQVVLKSARMKELKRVHGIINDRVHRLPEKFVYKTLLVTKLEFGHVETIPNRNAATHDVFLHV